MKVPEFQILPKYLQTRHSWAFTKCPDCGIIGFIDQDQFEGGISMLCDCGYHEYCDFRKHTSVDGLVKILGD